MNEVRVVLSGDWEGRELDDKNLEGASNNGKDGALTAQADEALSILTDLVDLHR